MPPSLVAPIVEAGVAAEAALPLRWRTPAIWASQVLRDPVAMLGDHAHLERKAASNALELLNRWPAEAPVTPWVSILAAVARDEAMHLQAVTRLLAARGGSLPRVHRNAYASALHALVRRGQGPHELADRLLVSALIEARSCERFALLAGASEDPELSEFYRGLYNSELGHYKVFLHLSGMVMVPVALEQRWQALLCSEATIIEVQSPGPRMHSGIA